jgi:hypothetical protein
MWHGAVEVWYHPLLQRKWALERSILRQMAHTFDSYAENVDLKVVLSIR